MTEPVIRLEDARLTLQGNAGPVEILRGITLDVARGETVGLVGPSGSGKSSLLMVMGGLEQATSGTIRALGQDLTAINEDALARFRQGRMGIVFQSFHLRRRWPLVKEILLVTSSSIPFFGTTLNFLESSFLGWSYNSVPFFFCKMSDWHTIFH